MRHFYVDASIGIGDKVKAGKTDLGQAQDLDKRYPGITNHTHVEMRDSDYIAYPDAKTEFTRYKDIDIGEAAPQQ